MSALPHRRFFESHDHAPKDYLREPGPSWPLRIFWAAYGAALYWVARWCVS